MGDAGSPGGELVESLVGFARELRAAGIRVGPGDILGYCAAAAVLDPSDLTDLYWAGRASLVTGHDQVPVYDLTFRRYFLGDAEAGSGPDRPSHPRPQAEHRGTIQVPRPDSGAGSELEQEAARLGLVAADVAVLRNRSFATCTPDELVALRRIMRSMRLAPPERRSRRSRRASSGPMPDMRRTVHQALRRGGEPVAFYRRRRRLKPRPLVLLLDVSGSMADYSRSLVQFAYSARRGSVSRVEVFCFGTRLTRVTRELTHRRPDAALDRAARAVVDWEGGTRIGESVDAFVRDWGRRGVARGGIVVICSDGLDRGDPELLDRALERLSRQCHRLVWLNPHRGDDRDFQPTTLGMMVAAPHVDVLLSGHDLGSLEELAAVLPTLSQVPRRAVAR